MNKNSLRINSKTRCGLPLGFTLVEVMVALFTSMLILLAVLTVFNTQHNQSIVQDQVGEMNQNARLALNILEKGINAAGFSFRNDSGTSSIDQRLAIMESNDIGGGGALNLSIAFPVPPVPPLKTGVDLIAVTTPFALPNPANNNAPESLCTNAQATVLLSPGTAGAAAQYKVCNTAGVNSNCQLLHSFLTASATWWTDVGVTPDQTAQEPTLLAQWTNLGVLQTQAAAITGIIFNNADAVDCGGLPSAQFNVLGSGVQITTQPPPIYVGPAIGTNVTLSVVSSYLYYVDQSNRFVRFPMGHSAATHILIGNGNFVLSEGADMFQAQFRDSNGNWVDTMVDGDLNGTNDTELINSVRIGLISITENPDALNPSATLRPLPLFDYTPGVTTPDKFHRKIYTRWASADNLQLLRN